MTFSLADTLDLLGRTPTVLDRLLRGSHPSWHAIDEGPGTWNALNVVGHLIHCEEANWVPRARVILDDGEHRPFDPFYRSAHFARFGHWSLDNLLDRFAAIRETNVRIVHGWKLTQAELSLRGRHPELGRVTLQQLLATWAVHDLTHIAQIVRVMAKRYCDEVGGWSEYLSILQRGAG